MNATNATHRLVCIGTLILSLTLVSCSVPVSAPTVTPPPPTAPPAATATSPAPQATATAAEAATLPATPTRQATQANSASLAVKGTAAIYLAGRDDVAIPALGVEDAGFPLLRCGTETALETFPAGLAVSPGAEITFKAGGTMDYFGGEQPALGPDASLDNLSSVDSLGGISTFIGPAGALVGVFLGEANAQDQPAPAPLDFTAAGLGVAFERLTPAIGQVFFVGDGLSGEGTGAAQKFVVPDGATRLFLGIADAVMFAGLPGCYGDNVGTFEVQVSSTGPLKLLAAAAGQSSGGAATATAQPTAETAETSAAEPTGEAAEISTAEPTGEAAATATPKPTAAGSQPTPSNAGAAGTGPKAYRIREVHREGDSSGPVSQEWTIDVIRQPLAYHYLDMGKQAMEVIVVGDSLWTRIGEMPWRETKQAEIGPDLIELGKSNPMDIQEGVPLENDLAWLLGQPHLRIAEGSTVPAGKEEANGVPCNKFTINSIYFYTATLPAPISATGVVTFEDRGEMWVAAQSGWPSFPVKVQVTEIVTTTAPGGSNVETSYLTQEITEINSPEIEIAPPQ